MYELLVDGNSNTDTAGPEGSERDEEIAIYLAAALLEDMLEHFHQFRCPCTQYGRMWVMVYLGNEVDCVLGTYHQQII